MAPRLTSGPVPQRRRGLGLEGDEGWVGAGGGSHHAELAQLREAMAASMAAQGQTQTQTQVQGQGQVPGPAPSAQQQPPPREEDVETLTAMGFARAEAVEALRSSLGNVEAAANALLSR